jgi:hypothetical protein
LTCTSDTTNHLAALQHLQVGYAHFDQSAVIMLPFFPLLLLSFAVLLSCCVMPLGVTRWPQISSHSVAQQQPATALFTAAA